MKTLSQLKTLSHHYRSNVIGTINLIDCAFLHGIHVTNMATGCIYEYDKEHEMYSGKGFTDWFCIKNTRGLWKIYRE